MFLQVNIEVLDLTFFLDLFYFTVCLLFQDGDSALHCAASRGHAECVKVLIDAGAVLNSVDKVGKPHIMNKLHHNLFIALLLGSIA